VKKMSDTSEQMPDNATNMVPEYRCNLILPGAGKSGTSSLHNILDSHPDIYMSKPKEPQFFSFEDRFSLGAVVHNQIFDGCLEERVHGESSQCYFAHPKAIARIKDALKNPKIIIMLRSPIDRLISQYAWNYRRGTEVSSLEEAIKLRGETTEYVYDERIGTYREIGGYVAFSRYSTWVPEWQRSFGNKSVLILSFENFVDNQQAVKEHCFDFLGLQPCHTPLVERANSTSKTVTQLLPSHYKLAAKLLPQSIKKGELYRKLRERIWMGRTPQPDTSLSPNLRNWLERELEHDIDFHRQHSARW